jgi:hypothetical protein
MTSLMGQQQFNGRQFVLDNVLQSDYCNVNDYDTTINNRHTEFGLTPKTIVKNVNVNGESMTCFTVVPMCRQSWRPSSKTVKSVTMKCAPVDSSIVDDLVDKLQSGLQDISAFVDSGLLRTWSTEIELPVACTPSPYGRYY